MSANQKMYKGVDDTEKNAFLRVKDHDEIGTLNFDMGH